MNEYTTGETGRKDGKNMKKGNQRFYRIGETKAS